VTYTFVSSDLASGALLTELPLFDVTYERLLDGAGRFQAKLKLPPITDARSRVLAKAWRDAIDRGRRVIYVLRDGVPLGGWVVWPIDYDADTQTVELAGAEWWSYWRRRFVGDWQANLLTPYTATGKAIDVAAGLVNASNGIGAITVLTSAPIAPTVDIEYQPLDAKAVADAVGELASAQDGFDFRSDVNIAAGAFVRRWVAAPFLGSGVTVTAQHGVNASHIRIKEAGDRRSNWVLAIGAGDGSARAFGLATSSDYLPQLSHSVSLRDEVSNTRLAQHAAAGLRVLENPSVTSADVVVDDRHCQLGVFAPGDLARIVIPPDTDSWFPDGYDAERRIVGAEVKPPGTGKPETVTFAFDDPAGAF
jgi:hypothetical protein